MPHHSDQHHHPHHAQGPWKPHKDWRVWVGVVLMLAAMVAYVLTNNESVQPGRGTQDPVPEAP